MFLWDYKSHTPKYGAASLRDRFHFLFTLGAVMRSDSLYRADLSDLCDFSFKQTRERDPYHVVVLRVGSGKTVKDKAHFGKVMRHKDVTKCAVGALGFWLMARFSVTNENTTMDFSDNSTWFNSKLLISTLSKEKSKSIAIVAPNHLL